MSRCLGKVKWFSNRKGYGFIIPTSENAPEEEVIFVHQTGINMDGEYRTLAQNSEVEFDVETEESGKLKAINVTAPGGVPIKQPPRRERKAKAKASKEDGGEGEVENQAPESAPPKKEPKAKKNEPKEPPFHDVISDEVKTAMKEKGLDLGRKATVDISHGESRIKLGQGGYTSMADSSAQIGEGTFTCDETGLVTFEWERSLLYVDEKWMPDGKDKLLKSLSLANDDVKLVTDSSETAESLWGTDKADPKDALVENEFKMKRVIIAPRNRRRPFRRNNGKKKAAEPKKTDEVAA